MAAAADGEGAGVGWSVQERAARVGVLTGGPGVLTGGPGRAKRLGSRRRKALQQVRTLIPLQPPS